MRAQRVLYRRAHPICVCGERHMPSNGMPHYAAMLRQLHEARRQNALLRGIVLHPGNFHDHFGIDLEDVETKANTVSATEAFRELANAARQVANAQSKADK